MSNTVITSKTFKKEKFTFVPPDLKNSKSKHQYIGFTRYNDKNFLLQTSMFKITQYGLPPKDGDYAVEESKRDHIRIGFDPEQKKLEKTHKILKALDEKASKSPKAVLGEIPSVNKYVYQPIVRMPQDHDDSDDEELVAENNVKEKKEKFPYCKAKFSLEYGTNKLLTRVFLDTDEGLKEIQLKTVNELYNYVKYQSSIKLLLTTNKVWAMKGKDAAGVRKYGVSLKILQIVVRPREDSSMAEQLNKYAFVEDSDDEGKEPIMVKKSEPKTSEPKESADEKEQDNSDNENSESEHEESDDDMKANNNEDFGQNDKADSESEAEAEAEAEVEKEEEPKDESEHEQSESDEESEQEEKKKKKLKVKEKKKSKKVKKSKDKDKDKKKKKKSKSASSSN